MLTGVDRKYAMLATAESADGEMSWEESEIVWLHGDARTVDVGRRFDLITRTGHTFQELLTDNDIRMVLSNVLRHLDTGGRFAFDMYRLGDEPLERSTLKPSKTRVATGSGECVEVVRARSFLSLGHRRMPRIASVDVD
ncbi:MAG TPA: class I SAM-dependent methyltransferase [Solirubrobacteraceae bacterium]|nr:class I SAM-dependent methyltransferase [Solirubrobacteraceae bacterium]